MLPICNIGGGIVTSNGIVSTGASGKYNTYSKSTGTFKEGFSKDGSYYVTSGGRLIGTSGTKSRREQRETQPTSPTTSPSNQAVQKQQEGPFKEGFSESGSYYVTSGGRLISTTITANRRFAEDQARLEAKDVKQIAYAQSKESLPGIYELKSEKYRAQYGAAVVTSLGEGRYGASEVKIPYATSTTGQRLYKDQIGVTSKGTPIFEENKKTVTAINLNQFDVSTPASRDQTAAYVGKYATAGALFSGIEQESKQGFTKQPYAKIPLTSEATSARISSLYRDKKIPGINVSAREFVAGANVFYSQAPGVKQVGGAITSTGSYLVSGSKRFKESFGKVTVYNPMNITGSEKTRATYQKFGINQTSESPTTTLGTTTIDYTGRYVRETGIMIETAPYTTTATAAGSAAVGYGLGYGGGKLIRKVETYKPGYGVAAQKIGTGALTGALAIEVVSSSPEELARQTPALVGGIAGTSRGYLRGVREPGFGAEVTPEEAGRITVKDFTVPRTVTELKSFEGSTARTTHVTTSKEVVSDLGKVDFITEARPEFAGGRKSVSSFGFFVSAPPKPIETIKIAGSLRTSFSGASGARPFNAVDPVAPTFTQTNVGSYSRRTGLKGYDYLAYAGVGEGSSSSIKPSVLPGTRVYSLGFDSQIGGVPKSVIARGPKAVNEWILRQDAAIARVPGENYAGSPEGQFVYPSRVTPEIAAQYKLDYTSPGVRISSIEGRPQRFYTVKADSKGAIRDFFSPPDTRAVQVIDVKATPTGGKAARLPGTPKSVSDVEISRSSGFGRVSYPSTFSSVPITRVSYSTSSGRSTFSSPISYSSRSSAVKSSSSISSGRYSYSVSPVSSVSSVRASSSFAVSSIAPSSVFNSSFYSSGVPVSSPVYSGGGFIPGLPNLYPPKSGSGVIKGTPRGFEYAPSLTAVAFNIRGSSRGRLSGVEVRPIASIRRKKKR